MNINIFKSPLWACDLRTRMVHWRQALTRSFTKAGFRIHSYHSGPLLVIRVKSSVEGESREFTLASIGPNPRDDMFILPTRGFLGYTGRQCAMLRKLALELIDDRLFAAIGDEMDHISDTHERALLTPQIGYSKSILRNVRIGYLFQATDVFDARYIDPGLSFTLPDGVYFNLDEVLEKLAVISPMRRPFRYPLNPIQCEPLPLP